MTTLQLIIAYIIGYIHLTCLGSVGGVATSDAASQPFSSFQMYISEGEHVTTLQLIILIRLGAPTAPRALHHTIASRPQHTINLVRRASSTAPRHGHHATALHPVGARTPRCLKTASDDRTCTGSNRFGSPAHPLRPTEQPRVQGPH